MDNLVLIDANSLINRAFYALPPLNNAEGTPTQAVYGFTTMLLKLIETYKPTYIAAAFDLPAPTFRHKMYEGYKATRKGMPNELALQVPLLKDLLRAMNIAVVEKEGFEADDIIGTLTKRFDKTMTYIVTGDRDSFQLIDEFCEVLITKRGITEILKLDSEELKKSYSLTPDTVVEYKALAGDSSDNIPGVAGIGEKTALSLLDKYGNLDNIFANVGEIGGKLGEKLVAGKDMAYLSKELATINVDAPIDVKLDDLTYDFPFDEKVRELFGKYNFKSLYKKEELFCKPQKTLFSPQIQEIKAEDIKIKGDFALHLDDKVYIGDEENNFIINVSQTLFGEFDSEEKIFDVLKPYIENEKRLKVVFDYKGLLKKFEQYDIKPKNVFDIKLGQYLIAKDADFSQFSTLLKDYGFEPSGYGAYKVYLAQKQLLGEFNLDKLYYEVELPLEEVLFSMEKEGFKLDLEKLEQLREDYLVQIEECAQKIYQLAGKKFNINSPKQLAEVLFVDLKIPYPKKSKSYSTSAEILELLKDEYEIVNHVLRYRFMVKLNSTYLEGLKKQTDKNGCVHTEFKQMLTATGRLSSVEPNLQNIPVREDEGRALREMFVAKEGNLLVCADYSQIELRVMAHLSGDERMVECYNKGEDIHSATASEVFSVSLDEVTDKMRRMAKTVNFGIIYGISDYGLSKSLKIPVSVARDYIKKYFEKFSGVKQYLEKAVKDTREKGYATSLFGRIRYVPEINSPSFATRSFGERVAMNMPLQATAADIIKIAMLKVSEALKDTNAKIILQVHDELIVETPISEAESVKEILKDCMESAVSLSVPLIVSINKGKNWLECK